METITRIAIYGFRNHEGWSVTERVPMRTIIDDPDPLLVELIKKWESLEKIDREKILAYMRIRDI